MSSSGNYPLGAEHDPAAPWNDGAETKRITVSVTYSKDFVIEVPKGCSEEDMKELVRGAIITPKDVMDTIHARNTKHYTEAYGGWVEDDFTVVE